MTQAIRQAPNQAIAYHAGHRFVGGIHRIASCPKCRDLVQQADAIAQATTAKGDDNETQD